MKNKFCILRACGKSDHCFYRVLLTMNGRNVVKRMFLLPEQSIFMTSYSVIDIVNGVIFRMPTIPPVMFSLRSFEN